MLLRRCTVAALAVAAAAALVVDAEKATNKAADAKKYGTVIGIDLGTTYSCVGVFKGGRVEIIANDQGHRITPSYVAFTEDGERLIGDAAKNQYASNPTNTVYDAKRLIGRRFDDREVQDDMKHFPFAIVSRDGRPAIKVKVRGEDKRFSPEEISGMVLQKMKEIAESYLGETVTHAVVTVPAYFNDAQRAATKAAGTIAGLTVLRIVNEPTAAAIAYGLDKTDGDRSILVYDLGGGTFDVSLLSIDSGVFEVLATAGDTHLGGEDFDQRVIDHFVGLWNEKHAGAEDVRKDLKAMGKLKREVEKAKRTLSSALTTRIEIDSFAAGEDFSESLTRAKFEELNMDLFRKTIKPVERVLKDAKVEKTGVHELVLVGGSTRIPKVVELLEEFFDGKKANKEINPDEAVAYGAAVQGGILSGADATSDVLLLDVTPLTLGIEVKGGVMSKLIQRNTQIPTKKTDTYVTTYDNQDRMTIDVYEGERAMAKDNNLLGGFEMTGIPAAPRGVAQVSVTFEIDSNGILKVSAVDKATGKSESITITNDKGRLSEDDIERMVKEAEQFAEEDRRVKERVDARHALENYIHDVRQQSAATAAVGKKMSDEERSAVSAALSSADAWMRGAGDGATREDYEEKKAEIETVYSPIVKRVYGGDGSRSSSDATREDHDEL